MHFVKHSLALAMLAILTGCGGGGSSSSAPANNTPDDTTPAATTISGVSPQVATVGVLTTFTLTGSNMNSKMQISLPNCQNISGLTGSTTSTRFTCTPLTDSTQTLTVKTETGSTLLSSEIKFQAAGTGDDVVVDSIDAPTLAFAGQVTTFTIKGKNLLNTLQISLSQCSNLTQTSVTATQVIFTCTPQTAGDQELVIRNTNGTILKRQKVIVPATLTGTWRQTVSNGCTGTVEGEKVAGAISVMPLFSLVRDSTTRVRFIGNDAISYAAENCTIDVTKPEDALKIALTTGTPDFSAIYEDVSAAQRADDTVYYAVRTSYTNNNVTVPSASALVFKDASTFCLFDGTVNTANISQFIAAVDLTKPGCFTRITVTPFSQKAPAAPTTSALGDVVQRQQGELLLNVLERLNERGKDGYFLLNEAQTLRSTINGATANSYDILSKVNAFGALTFNYQQQDEDRLEPAENSRLAQLNDLGSKGLLYLGNRKLDPVFGERPTFVKTNISQTFTYQLRTNSNVNATNLTSILNAEGDVGCRFIDIRPKTTATNTYTTVCVDSSRHTGSFNYRYVAYPTSTRVDAFVALLDQQKADGYYPIRVIQLNGMAAPQILFERNSVTEAGVKSLEYKVFSQGLPNNQPELSSLLNDQGGINWHLWGQINNAAGTPFATIFARSPYPYSADGESASLHRSAFSSND